jgi:hypothetical protein
MAGCSIFFLAPLSLTCCCPVLPPPPPSQSLLRCRWAPDLTFQLAWLLKVALGVAAALEHMHYR